VPNRVWVPVVERLAHLPTPALVLPQEWFARRASG
jgi:hypothetical protein